MIELQLTKQQAQLVWLAVKQAETYALLNEKAAVGDALNFIRRELEYKRKELTKGNQWNKPY